MCLSLLVGCGNPKGKPCGGCKDKQSCVGNVCVDRCEADKDCSENLVCNLVTRLCEEKPTGTPSRCGDGIVTLFEQCDGSNLSGQTCKTQGFATGELRCGKDCKWDTSGCKNEPKCGNGVLEVGEACDGKELNNRTCKSQGFQSGTLQCSKDCLLDTSGCVSESPTCKPTCPSNQVCNTQTKTCVGCLKNSDCKQGLCSNKQCVECAENSDCKQGVCSANRCVGCVKDSDCTSKVCVSNQCVACRSNAECSQPKASRCANNTCSACKTNADCSHISGKPECKSGVCSETFKCEDWDNDKNAPCPKGTKNCDCKGGCGAVTCGTPGGATTGCFTVKNTGVRSFEPPGSNGHGSGSFLWKPVSESNGKLVVLFPSKLPANKAWVETPAGAKEFSNRVVVGNPDRKTHYFSKPGGRYPSGSKACWSSK